MVMVYSNCAKGRGEILRKAENRPFEAILNSPKDVARITKWTQKEGRLEHFPLMLYVEATIRERGEYGEDDLLPVTREWTVFKLDKIVLVHFLKVT